MRDREHDDLSSKKLLALHSIEDAEPKFQRAFKIEVAKGISANANILSLHGGLARVCEMNPF